jgi:hypothetical protein
MRTSFHHQSEAQPPNGPLTAATSPDTPSPEPIPAILRGRIGRLPVSARKKDGSEAVQGQLSLASENRFPVRGEGAARDSVRMRQRPVCMPESREELAHDGHEVVDVIATTSCRWRGCPVGELGKAAGTFWRMRLSACTRRSPPTTAT